MSGGFGLGYGVPYYAMAGPNGVSTYVPPILFMGPGGLPGMPGFNPIPVAIGRGPAAPPPPPGIWRAGVADQEVNKNKRKDPARAVQLTTFGDRLFRAGNLKKAEERYHQALKAASNKAAPYLRLEQVAWSREAITPRPPTGFVMPRPPNPAGCAIAPDVQSLYAEPAEFSRHVTRLESYLQIASRRPRRLAGPGAQWFLSGRTGRPPTSLFASTIRTAGPTLRSPPSFWPSRIPPGRIPTDPPWRIRRSRRAVRRRLRSTGEPS